MADDKRNALVCGWHREYVISAQPPQKLALVIALSQETAYRQSWYHLSIAVFCRHGKTL